MASQYSIAFWNLENLFDIENSPRRTDKLKRALGDELKGWTQAILDTKINQLASIIVKLNGGKGPDILGVCEVENKYVMEKLVQALSSLGRTYGIEHHDTKDERGIDVGFIFDSTLFSVEAQFFHVVMRRTATREIFQVNFKTPKNRRLVLVGNHWPSRSGGSKFDSEGYRAIAGETLAYFHQRILEECGTDTPVLAMGDFNDEPFDRSLVDYALSLRSLKKVVNARTVAYFLNLMWPVVGQGKGSLYYDNLPNVFDQFLANENLLKRGVPIRLLTESAAIADFAEMTDTGAYPKPIPFGRPSSTLNKKGFSDHFPVVVTLEEAD